MKSESLRSVRLPLVLVTIVVVIAVLTIWGVRSPNDEPIYGSFSVPSYESIEALAADSDVIIDGIVGEVAGRETDFGTSNADERVEGSGVPVVFYDVAVLDTLKGQTASKIVVGNVDGEKLISDQSTPLNAGDQVLLFLVEQNAEKDSPGITLYNSYYTTLSLDVGVFDVLEDGTVRPRAGGFMSTSGNASFERSEIEQLVAGD